jgi:hypothetical protein
MKMEPAEFILKLKCACAENAVHTVSAFKEL